jgi:hypothetical protein
MVEVRSRQRSEQEYGLDEATLAELRELAGSTDDENLLSDYPRGADWILLEKLAGDVCAAFSQLARIPDSNAKIFSENILFILMEWLMFVINDTSRTKDRFSDQVTDTRHKASALRRQLEDLHGLLKEEDGRRLARCGHPDILNPLKIEWHHSYHRGLESDLARVLKALAALLSHFPSRPRGRPRGAKAYPGLDYLVCQLDFLSRSLTGRFTLDKRLRKGTIIRALNWLRAHLLSEPEWKSAAEYLPTPNCHPVAMYESALRAGRNQARLEAARMARIRVAVANSKRLN